MISQRVNDLGQVCATGSGLWIGEPSGSTRYLLPFPATQACWVDNDTIACQYDTLNDDTHWKVIVVNLVGGWADIAGPSNWVRAGGGVVLYQGGVRWSDGRTEALPNCVYPCAVSAEGYIAYSWGEKQTIRVQNAAGYLLDFSVQGIGDDAVSGPDVSIASHYMLVRTYGEGQVLFDLQTGSPIAGLVKNANANLSRLVLIMNGDSLPIWIAERTSRDTLRPFDSPNGIVVQEGQDSFGFDATTISQFFASTYWTSQATVPQTWSGVNTIANPQLLPRVDVLMPALQPRYDYLPMQSQVIDLGYYKRDHAPDSHGSWFDTPPTTPANVPGTYCYPETQGEVDMAIAAGVQCMVTVDTYRMCAPEHVKGFSVRQGESQTGPSFKEQLAIAIPYCEQHSKPLMAYDDAGNPTIPADLPSWAGIEVNCYVGAGVDCRSLVEAVRPRIDRVLALRPGGYLLITFPGFDDNTPQSRQFLLNRQTAIAELCRLYPQIVGVSIFNGGRADLVADPSYGGSYFNQLLPEHRAFAASIPAGPSRWPVPPPPIPPILGDDMTTWAIMQQEISAACFCAGLSQPDTHNEEALNKDRFIGQFAAEQWPPQRILQSILVKKWPTLQISDCEKNGQALSVAQIAAVWSVKP